jgi:glycosyltransferase involved in cell wall biosynthesis
MHLLILTESFFPETKSASILFFELAESLVKKGHEVSVITRWPRYNIAAGANLNKISSKETIAGITVYRLQTPPLARNIPIIRGIEQFLLAVIFFIQAIKIKQYDAVLVYCPPVTLGVAGCWLGRWKKKSVVVNIQDLYPQTVIDLGLLKNKLLIKLSEMMESYIYDKADCVTVHSEDNKQYILEKGRKKPVDVIYNWVDAGLICPGPQNNSFSAAFGLRDKFIISYAGVIGFAQGLEVVLDVAKLLQDNENILFVLVGDGVKKRSLEIRARQLNLRNVLFLPTQPLGICPQILNASDLCFLSLNKAMSRPPIPGKLLNIFSAGKPVVASIPVHGEAAEIIKKYQCGISVDPGNPTELARAIYKLYNNRSLINQMGENGRRLAVAVFSRQIAVAKYESLFNGLINNSRDSEG